MNINAYIANLEPEGYQVEIHKGLEFINFGEMVSSSSKVFIKPNLTYPEYRRGVMTNPEAVEAAVLAIRDYTPNILIGDADSGGYNRFSMDAVYSEIGLHEFARINDIEIVNLSKLERKTHCFEKAGNQYNLDLPKLLTDEIDLLITMPVPKIHANTGVSLSFKNQWGCIPEPNDRLRFHPSFQQVVLDVNHAVNAKVAIIDGKYGLNINGPMKGHAIDLGWLLISNDIGASTRIACELMQINLMEIAHLRYAYEQGVIPERSELLLNSELDAYLKEKFYLRREITDIPGYLAFNSRIIAYFAYFSPISDLLHKLLYLVRDPLYDYEKYSKKKS